jgi:hypothetical protein
VRLWGESPGFIQRGFHCGRCRSCVLEDGDMPRSNGRSLFLNWSELRGGEVGGCLCCMGGAGHHTHDSTRPLIHFLPPRPSSLPTHTAPSHGVHEENILSEIGVPARLHSTHVHVASRGVPLGTSHDGISPQPDGTGAWQGRCMKKQGAVLGARQKNAGGRISIALTGRFRTAMTDRFQ